MRTFLADLHIHTGLSPCAAEEMTPPAVVDAALAAGLDLIAICDHNSATNAGAALLAADGRVAVLAGMEITTVEEAHVLGLFPGPISALVAAEEVLETLPVGDAAYRQRFGAQRIMNADGQITAYEDRMLAVASRLDVSAAVALVHRHGGMAIAAHVNRSSFSVLSQLGVFPTEAGFDAIEVFTKGNGVKGHRRNTLSPSIPGSQPAPWASYGLPILTSSDSHFLGDIGRCRTVLRMEEPSFDELVLALRGEGGRGVGDA
ncbi:MAG: PHP-associated domain-containing protein [Planctomycetota bacterium]